MRLEFNRKKTQVIEFWSKRQYKREIRIFMTINFHGYKVNSAETTFMIWLRLHHEIQSFRYFFKIKLFKLTVPEFVVSSFANGFFRPPLAMQLVIIQSSYVCYHSHTGCFEILKTLHFGCHFIKNEFLCFKFCKIFGRAALKGNYR